MTPMTLEPPQRMAAAAPAIEAAADPVSQTEDVVRLLSPGEVVILCIKPSILFVPLASLSSLLGIAVAVFFLAWLDLRFVWIPWTDSQAIAVGVFLGAVRLGWQFLEWVSRVYILTDRRVIRRKGVLRVSVFECRLEHLQQTAVLQSLRERVAMLGTVCFATAGAAAFVALWEYVARPFDVQRAVADAVDRYGRGG